MRHGIEMTSQHYPFVLVAPCVVKFSARDKRVAVAGHLQVRQAAQGALDRVRERALRTADRGDVNKGGGELGAVGVQVKVIHGDNLSGAAR
jgi:hypothetical protein